MKLGELLEGQLEGKELLGAELLGVDVGVINGDEVGKDVGKTSGE